MKDAQFDAAIALLLTEAALVASHPVSANTLAYLLLQQDRPLEAIEWFERICQSKPDDLQAAMGCGRAHEAVGAHDRALQYYEIVVGMRPGNAEAWYRHGCALIALQRTPAAIESLRRAFSLDANHGAAVGKLRDLLEKAGEFQGAIEAAIACCRAMPKQALPLRKLADLLQRVGQLDQAIGSYDMALKFDPQDFHAYHNKAMALRQADRTQEALAAAQQALRLKPEDSDTMMMCGGFELALGNRPAAHACFGMVAARGVARQYSALSKPPAFRASLLFSPVSGNTPYDDLIRDSNFESDLFVMLPEFQYDPRTIDAAVDVVVNLVSEADLSRDIIASVVELADQFEKPVVNHPSLILATDRQSIATRLAGMADIAMPGTVRLLPEELRQHLAKGIVSFPSIIRHAGTHGGDRMEKVENEAELLAFAAEAGDSPLYLTQYVDYASADGLFRKYRFIFVGDEILPYHLAIGDQWKVHHASTRMAEVEWMRQEEMDFLDNPASVFAPPAMAALDAIRREVGLDYFGIDCSLDAGGRVVVFEVNASMLVHLNNTGFEYKNPHVHRIRAAFEAMLARKAGRSMPRT